MSVNWTEQLAEQLDWHWTHQLRARLDGLTDEEYFWEPGAGCWNVRRRDESAAAFQPGSGEWTIDWEMPEPQPPPVTTIAWRLAHLNIGVLGARNHAHFGGPAVDYDSYPYEGTAAAALAHLDEHYAAWIAGVRAMTADDLAAPCGDREPGYPDYPRAALVLHINREVMHHGAEIALLRDLYAHR